MRHPIHTLADPTRLRIVQRLAEGELCVCDLTEALETAQSRLSFHLKTLKEAGVLKDRRQGRWVYYALNSEVLEEMGSLLGSLATAPGTRVSATRCCD